MSDFVVLRDLVQKQLQLLYTYPVFRVAASEDTLWETYLGGFKPEDDPIYKEKTEHNCQCCRQFIRDVGSMVAYIDGKLVSIWDIDTTTVPKYKNSVEALKTLVLAKRIENVYLHYQHKVGTAKNFQELGDGEVKQWDHLHTVLPDALVSNNLGTILGDKKNNKAALKASLNVITPQAVETVLDLIASNNLYRGEEFKDSVKAFKLLQDNESLAGNTSLKAKDTFYWLASHSNPHVCRMKNTVIGTLLVDLSEGVDIEPAVAKYESKVSAGSYKRTTALITPKMIEKAQAKVAELGLEGALERRYATKQDIAINDIIYADRSISHLNRTVFDSLLTDIKPSKFNIKNALEISMEDFIDSVVPYSEKIEARVGNSHLGNFVSLISPQDKEAKNMLQWSNNFTWSYKGEVTDSIKERVKAAGGKIDGVLRVSLSWFNGDDLDIHCAQSEGSGISFSNRYCKRTTGTLDVDMNAGGANNVVDPVENITWSKEVDGVKSIVVHNYARRASFNVGFTVEVEYKSQVHTFVYNKAVRDGEKVPAVGLTFKDGVMSVDARIPSTTAASKDVWGVSTEQFHDVKVICNSPNYWNGNQTGNRHWFFMLKGCKNPEESRGFYNEFLDPRLREHRKVFEMLGAKMRVSKSEHQLSGLGFSSTLENTLYCRVTKESKQRLYKVNIK